MANTYEPDFLVTPGEVLDSYLASMNMRQVELSERTGLTKKTINEIIKGKAAISPETSLKLEKALGRPAHFWNNLERQYQEDKARLLEKEQLQHQLEWLKTVPIAAMAKLGWIEKTKDKLAQLDIVLRYFGVASPQQWQVVWANHRVAYRKSAQDNDTKALALSAWLRQGEIMAGQVQCAPFNGKSFLEILEDLREYTLQPPETFLPNLTEKCANAGVAVVFVPELPGTGVYGCTRWLGNKAVIQLSLRYKSNDHLWFTFFHEAGHIIKHGKKEIFLEGNGMHGEKEEEANAFARNHLIPSIKYQEFLASWDKRSLEPIKDFARKIGIAPGIVVGRLQYEKRLSNAHGNKLKVFYHWK